MSQPLLATDRIKLIYAVLGLDHVWHGYVKPGPLIGAVPSLVDRHGVSGYTWAAAAQSFWGVISGSLINMASIGISAVLEHFDGTAWNPVDFASLTSAAGIGVVSQTQQTTWVLRDTAFKKIRMVFLETNQGFLGHWDNGLGGIAALNTVTALFNGTDTSQAAPHEWQVSRGNRYMLATGTVAGLTLDQNQKLKRARHAE